MRILCATDFSEPARAAADLAGALAAKLGDSVKLLHVVELPPLIGEEAAAAGEASWEKAMREAAERELGRARQALADRGVAAEFAVQIGPASEIIRTEAAAADMRLVVVGTHGRKGAAHFFLGSVAEDVARSCPCPVVVTRGVPFPEDGLDPRRRLHLMLAVDGSPGAEAALGWAKALRMKLPCNVTLVQPCWPPAEAQRFGLDQAWAGGRQIHPSLLPLLDRELRRWAGEFPGEGDVRCRFPASHGRIAEDLATEAELLLPDLVVMGASKRPLGGLSGLTTQGALHAIKIPVVCVPETMRPPPVDGIPVVATVLVGTDMSDFSNQAIAGAYSLLRGTGGQRRDLLRVRARRRQRERHGSAGRGTAAAVPAPRDRAEAVPADPSRGGRHGHPHHGQRRRGQLTRGRPAARGRAHRRRRAGGGLARQGGHQADADRLGRRSRRPPQHPPGAGPVSPPALSQTDGDCDRWRCVGPCGDCLSGHMRDTIERPCDFG